MRYVTGTLLAVLPMIISPGSAEAYYPQFAERYYNPYAYRYYQPRRFYPPPSYGRQYYQPQVRSYDWSWGGDNRGYLGGRGGGWGEEW